MKRMSLVLALAIPAAAWAAGVPGPQIVPAPAKPAVHRPLVYVKYVLLPAPKTADDAPRIDYSESSAAMLPLHLDWPGSKAFGAFAVDPNVEICRQWACETSGHR
ncbi:hypothetical protein [Dyella agri]|uniref:Uncharacterized protein n=1 Tax=Dyella agri TaxID=1926869 RepID=A0ABW8KLG6_9GAMM